MTLLPQPDYSNYLLDSEEYWWQMRGAPEPPPPTYRQVNGKMVLGRYVDPYGAQGLMADAKNTWTRWYTMFLISVGIAALIGGVDWVFLFLALPVFVVVYLAVRAKQRRLYDSYYAILQEINRTGRAMWVPYNKERLKLIDRRPQAVWP